MTAVHPIERQSASREASDILFLPKPLIIIEVIFHVISPIMEIFMISDYHVVNKEVYEKEAKYSLCCSIGRQLKECA